MRHWIRLLSLIVQPLVPLVESLEHHCLVTINIHVDMSDHYDNIPTYLTQHYPSFFAIIEAFVQVAQAPRLIKNPCCFLERQSIHSLDKFAFLLIPLDLHNYIVTTITGESQDFRR